MSTFLRRLNLYLEDATKISSVSIRVAAVISLHAIEDFMFRDDDLEMRAIKTEMTPESFLRVPEHLEKQGFKETMRA